jgi:hypothetical protein
MDCQDKGQLGEEGIGGNPKVASRLVTSLVSLKLSVKSPSLSPPIPSLSCICKVMKFY